jgi:hypothetical protein
VRCRSAIVGGTETSLADESFPVRRTFDLVLGVTLRGNGVTELFTRNTADFEGIPGLTAVNPID